MVGRLWEVTLLSEHKLDMVMEAFSIHSPTHAVMPHQNLKSIDWK